MPPLPPAELIEERAFDAAARAGRFLLLIDPEHPWLHTARNVVATRLTAVMRGLMAGDRADALLACRDLEAWAGGWLLEAFSREWRITITTVKHWPTGRRQKRGEKRETASEE